MTIDVDNTVAPTLAKLLVETTLASCVGVGRLVLDLFHSVRKTKATLNESKN